MSTELFTRTEQETLPDHMAFGLHDGANKSIDEYVEKVNDRIDDAITERIEDVEVVEDIEAIATELIVDEVAEKLAEVMQDPDAIDIEEIERELRRRRIIAGEQHKRRFARPILSYASVYYPPKRY